MEGWIKLHRKILENPVVCKDGDHVAVWTYLLLNATHKEYPAVFAGEKILLQPGQLITGRTKISERFNISESKVQRILKLFENEQQIEQQGSNRNRLVSILSWCDYQTDEQQNEQPVNTKRTTTEQPVNTNKNVKNVKEQKNEEKEDKKPPTPKNPKRIYSEDDKYFKLSVRFHELAFKNAEDLGTSHLIKSPDFQKWADIFRLMFERDGVKDTEIGEVVKFALTDDFYQTIIFSPQNLRKHYKAIFTKMRTNQKRPAQKGYGNNKPLIPIVEKKDESTVSDEAFEEMIKLAEETQRRKQSEMSDT